MKLSNLSQMYLITELIESIQRDNTNTLYKNIPIEKIRQASVALILRFDEKFSVFDKKAQILLSEKQKKCLDYNEFKNIIFTLCGKSEDLNRDSSNIFEFLFIQRAINKKDENSGQIALPGSKCDNEETDIEALERELNEEIGIDVANPNTYFRHLGKIKKNFLYSKSKKKTTFSSLALYFDFGRNQYKVNPSEIQEIKWIPAIYFVNIDLNRFFIYEADLNFLLGMFSNIISQNKAKEIQKFYLSTAHGSIDIGMNSRLWGFTLHMFIYIWEHLERIVKNCKNKELTQFFEKNQFSSKFLQAVKKSTEIQTNLSPAAPQELRNLAKIFDLEYFFLVHLQFGLNSEEKYSSLKIKMTKIIYFILVFILFRNISSKL